MKPKKNLYHKFVFEKLVSFNVVLSDSDLSKMNTLAKHQCYVTVNDYLISLITSKYEIIDASAIVKIKNPSEKYNKEIHDLNVHQLVHPKLLKSNSDILDDKQATLDGYFE